VQTDRQTDALTHGQMPPKTIPASNIDGAQGGLGYNADLEYLSVNGPNGWNTETDQVAVRTANTFDESFKLCLANTHIYFNCYSPVVIYDALMPASSWASRALNSPLLLILLLRIIH